jgi:hypothetical protein
LSAWCGNFWTSNTRRWTERVEAAISMRDDRSHFPLLDRRPQKPRPPPPGFLSC